MSENSISGWVSNIERYTLHDGPGIRTTVFLKGCPLRCLWCSNPETQVDHPQLIYLEEKCNGCLRCIEICPQKAISIRENSAKVDVDFKKCDHCGQCVTVCNVDALIMSGERLTAREVVDVVARDKVFYRHSSGGVTLSGGDPFWQPEFSAEILRLCQADDIHTAIQTCAYATREQLDLLIPHLDLAIVDIKHSDSDTHIKLTGKPNKTILENISYIDSRGIPIVIQIPLIPGFNDADNVLRDICNFTATLKNALGVSLLVYHTLGVPKYKSIGRTYTMPPIETPPADYLQEKIAACRDFGANIVQFMEEGITYA